MASLTESSTYEAWVYQLEITDAVIGGANGLSNLQAKQLANRTNWLNTNKQDKDATLTAIAALTTAADKLIYATGADIFSTTTLTAFARTLLDDADAATMRATLGVVNGIGGGQTLQNVAASRALGTTYTNSTGNTIYVYITETNTGAFQCYVDNELVFYAVGTSVDFTAIFPVPNNSTYYATGAGLLYWKELR